MMRQGTTEIVQSHLRDRKLRLKYSTTDYGICVYEPFYRLADHGYETPSYKWAKIVQDPSESSQKRMGTVRDTSWARGWYACM